jgi:hypothetical protein
MCVCVDPEFLAFLEGKLPEPVEVTEPSKKGELILS